MNTNAAASSDAAFGSTVQPTTTTKPKTWYLEMKVGTVFAFRLNADETIRLAREQEQAQSQDGGSDLSESWDGSEGSLASVSEDSDLSSSSSSSAGYENESKVMVGYVRHVRSYPFFLSRDKELTQRSLHIGVPRRSRHRPPRIQLQGLSVLDSDTQTQRPSNQDPKHQIRIQNQISALQLPERRLRAQHQALRVSARSRSLHTPTPNWSRPWSWSCNTGQGR